MRKLFRYGVLSVLLGCSIAFPALSDAQQSSQAGKVFKWRGACFHAQAMSGGESFIDFCKYVKEMSGGRLDITPYCGQTLVSGDASFDSLKSGVVEVSCLNAGYHLGKLPEANMEAGPTGMMNLYVEEHDFWWHGGGGNEYMREAYAPHNIYFLGISLAGPIGLLSRKPIKTVADFKGMKIRTAGTLAAISEQLGAKTVAIPLGEVVTALQLGVVDAATYSDISSWVANGWHDVAKYGLSGFFKKHGATNISVNMKAWKSLPPDLQAIMHYACEIACYRHEALEISGNVEARKKMEKAGGQIVNLSEKDKLEVEKARYRVWDIEVKKGPRTAKAIELYKAWLLKKGYPKTW